MRCARVYGARCCVGSLAAVRKRISCERSGGATMGVRASRNINKYSRQAGTKSIILGAVLYVYRGKCNNNDDNIIMVTCGFQSISQIQRRQSINDLRTLTKK